MKTLTLHPLHPLFVAEVQGLDLRQPIDAALATEIEAARKLSALRIPSLLPNRLYRVVTLRPAAAPSLRIESADIPPVAMSLRAASIMRWRRASIFSARSVVGFFCSTVPT